MQFGNFEIAWLLLLVPLSYLLVRRQEKRRSAMLARFGDQELLGRLINGARSGKDKWMLALIVLLLTLTVLRPQWGFVWKEGTRSGVDIVIALDVSESMMATDVLPNRLIRAKREIQDLLQKLKGDRVALVSFAGTAYVESPLTLDYGAYKVFLSSLKPELIPIPGTNLEGAIVEGIKTFIRGAPGKKQGQSAERDRALILITDGEDFEGDFDYAAALAKEEGVTIYVFGIGTPEGSPIPTQSGYKRDKDGSIIISRLNERALQELAAETGGIYVRSISSARDTSAIYNLGIRKSLEAREFEYGRSKRWNEYYQLPLAAALLLLLFGLWNSRARSTSVANSATTALRTTTGLSNPSSTLKALLPLLILLTPQIASAQSAEKLGLAAKEAYDEGRYEEAKEQFSAAAQLKTDDPRFKLGEGAGFYRLRDFERAKAAFIEAATLAEDGDKLKAHALFNAGNAMVQLDQLQEAIDAYQNALRISPEDSEIADNLEYAKILLRQKHESPDQKDKRREEQEQQQGQSEQQQEQGQSGEKDKQQNREQKQQQQQQEQANQEQSEEEQNADGDSSANEESEQDGQEQDGQEQDGQEQGKDGDSGNRQQQEQQGSKGQGQDSERPGEDPSPAGADGTEKNEGEGKKSESKEEQRQGAQPTSPPDNAEENKEQSSHAGNSGPTEQQRDSRGADSTDQRFEQGEAMLNTIDEKVGERMKYRLREGMRQLQEQEKRIPEKDW